MGAGVISAIAIYTGAGEERVVGEQLLGDAHPRQGFIHLITGTGSTSIFDHHPRIDIVVYIARLSFTLLNATLLDTGVW